MGIMRSTVVVQGPLAFGMQRAAAARRHQSGLQIVSIAQLAGRLAGGFAHQATAAALEPAIRQALAAGDFQEIEHVRALPGMTRAVKRTLQKAWNADLNLAERASRGSPRIADLALIEARIRALLPRATLLPSDLRDAALARIHFAPQVLGPLRLEGVHFVDPVWRLLLNKLVDVVPIEWNAPPEADTSWFAGELRRVSRALAIRRIVSCADARHEALEALRWARELLSSGKALAGDIAICATATDEWDEHVLSLARAAGLRVHFPHGVTCLSSRDGQRCAALADVLLNGLTQTRVRRLFSLVAGQGLTFDRLPAGWLSVPRGAALSSVAEWKRALDVAHGENSECHAVVLPALNLLEGGVSTAVDAAAALLRGRSKLLWEIATRAAPVEALELTLRSIRVSDAFDPADAVAWCPASQLAAAPRPFVRLLGLTARGWPRRPGEDPILPDHLLPGHELDSDPSAEADKRAFEIICGSASKDITLSHSRRSSQGGLIGASPLLMGVEGDFLARSRLPEHAATESDRLSARPFEAAEVPQIKSGLACWRDWHDPKITSHDGLVRARHPAIMRALTRIQSPTSLTRLLRDPVGYVWRYALGWQTSDERELSLSLPPDEFGQLVHELLRRTVNTLEPVPGLNAAKDHEIEAAIEQAVAAVLLTWPIERPVPPHVLWQSTVRQAAEMSFAGLKMQEVTESGTRSWTEVPFGLEAAPPSRDLPWDPLRPVTIPGTRVSITGSIDRIDLRDTGLAVRVTDYKTGAKPRDPNTIVIGGGRELQRALYALACRQLLTEVKHIRARLVYIRGAPAAFPLSNPDGVFPLVAQFVVAAVASLESGHAVPGPDTEQPTNDLRFALPVSPGYFRRKGLRFRDAVGLLSRYWSQK